MRAQDSLLEKFEKRFIPEPNSGCWLWTAGCVGNGYAAMLNPVTRKMVVEHRFSYETFKGPIPLGLDLGHLCRVRCCVNPDHLEPVTRKENLYRSPIWNGNHTQCPQGHPYNEENTHWGKGGPKCRVCDRAAHQVIRDKRLKCYATWGTRYCYRCLRFIKRRDQLCRAK